MDLRIGVTPLGYCLGTLSDPSASAGGCDESIRRPTASSRSASRVQPIDSYEGTGRRGAIVEGRGARNIVVLE